MKTRVRMLKVKIKSLADEARIIRLEERRTGKDEQLRCELHQHRVLNVRQEQRVSLLAYAFLRGKPVAAIEPKRKTQPDWQRVVKLIEKFGVVSYTEKAGQSEAVKAWIAAARSEPVA